MKDFIIHTAGVFLDVVVMLSPIVIVKTTLAAKAGLGRVINGAEKMGQGVTGAARNRAQSSNMYQRRQMIRQARDNERRRGNVASYTELMTGDGVRSELARRRAAGGLAGQLFNTNQAGQERILTSAQEQLRKEQNEEAHRAAQRMTSLGIEGDDDLARIARMADGQVFRQTRNGVATGTTMQVNRAERQAAIEELVKQGRVGELRRLEAVGPARGPGGRPNPNNELHELLDEAYKEHGGKLGDKAPDLMPNRRATNGVAAFTDLKPDDVTGWHHSTVSAARNFYSTSRMVEDVDPATGLGLGTFHDQAPADREQMLRAFGQATTVPSAKSKMSLDQVRQVRNVLRDAQAAAIASGTVFDTTTAGQIETMYKDLGGL